jgi:hypothetical protein
MKSNYYDPYIAQYIHPKKVQSKTKDADKDFIFNEMEADLNKFDKIIDELGAEVAFTSINKKNTLKWRTKTYKDNTTFI